MFATLLVMEGVVCGLLLGTYSLRRQVQKILDRVPEAMSALSIGLAGLHKGQSSTMQKVQIAVNEIEKATTQVPDFGTTWMTGRIARRLILLRRRRATKLNNRGTFDV